MITANRVELHHRRWRRQASMRCGAAFLAERLLGGLLALASWRPSWRASSWRPSWRASWWPSWSAFLAAFLAGRRFLAAFFAVFLRSLPWRLSSRPSWRLTTSWRPSSPPCGRPSWRPCGRPSSPSFFADFFLAAFLADVSLQLSSWPWDGSSSVDYAGTTAQFELTPRESDPRPTADARRRVGTDSGMPARRRRRDGAGEDKPDADGRTAGHEKPAARCGAGPCRAGVAFSRGRRSLRPP